METIKWINDVNREDIAVAGGKGANLGEMLKNDFPVPPAFIVTADAFWNFLEETKIKDSVFNILRNINVDDSDDLEKKSGEIKKIITSANMTWTIEVDVLDAYRKLDDAFVAVRSSATAEDLPEASFAGQQDTYLNVKGEQELLSSVKKCWASLYTPRAIFYREKQGFKHEDVKLAVVVQKMVNADISGVMFTSDPITGKPKILIETGYGLGETIVGGKITPDTYIVDQDTLEIEDKNIATQKIKEVKGEDGKTTEVEVEQWKQDKQKMPDTDIVKLAEIGKRIEKHYNEPMDVEWCMENNEIYIVQARPVTTIKKGGIKMEKEEKFVKERKILVKGLPASPGTATGKVVIIKDSSELGKIKEGNILVTQMTTPDMVIGMKKASAIVTDEGGLTCHAAIVSRELGIPCIVGSGKATKVLKEGDEITVDASTGVVYEGIIKIEKKEKEKILQAAEYVPVTGTKIYMNLGVPEKAEECARLPVSGVGLMREEFTVTSSVGKHPLALIEQGKPEVFIDALVEAFSTVARAFYPRPVVLRTSDFKTNEYRNLEGGEKYESVEANPMIGWRGVSRYVSEKYEKAFRLELKAIKKVRDSGLKNLWLMLPFVRTVDEVKKALKIMKEEGLERNNDFKVWIMAEVPSNVFLADQFAELVDGFSIGSNDLTQLIMGADRDSEILAQLGYFDERNEAVKRAIAHLIKVAHEKGCTVSICGQAPSVYPEFTEFLVRNGIDSISLNADVVNKTIRLVASIEQKIMLENARKRSE
ncbi:MAG: phosphoenolpyruvate synthase [Candidatus Thermoplasmatota archaeon]|nr:phosphoenolpyruvate synthase [Candidatus Thermoplasmatota archaeon]